MPNSVHVNKGYIADLLSIESIFQSCVTFHCKLNDWFLYEMQHWAQMN